MLQSLNTASTYAGLTDYGKALTLALTDGVSRFDDATDRGYGFRPLFTGLANLHGMLRFRSGDHALTIDGQQLGTIPAKLAKKISINGFFASVNCQC